MPATHNLEGLDALRRALAPDASPQLRAVLERVADWETRFAHDADARWDAPVEGFGGPPGEREQGYTEVLLTLYRAARDRGVALTDEMKEAVAAAAVWRSAEMADRSLTVIVDGREYQLGAGPFDERVEADLDTLVELSGPTP